MFLILSVTLQESLLATRVVVCTPVLTTISMKKMYVAFLFRFWSANQARKTEARPTFPQLYSLKMRR